MIKLVGFNAAFGDFVPEGSTTGEVVSWSNRTLRCVTDDGLKIGDFGLAVIEQKFKKSEVCASLNLDKDVSEDYLNDVLSKILNKNIEFTIGLGSKEMKINGFRVVEK